MQHKPSRGLIWVIAGMLSIVACKRIAPAAPFDRSQLEVMQTAHLRVGPIGMGANPPRTSFVLVDVVNHGSADADVTLGGELQTKQGGRVTGLVAEWLRVPKGARRTFALLAQSYREEPDAAGAQVRVLDARFASAPPAMELANQRSYDDFGKPVVEGWVKNTASRIGRAMVLATFYDRDDRPVIRRFAHVQLGASATTSVQFVGPPDSIRGELAFGEIVY